MVSAGASLALLLFVVAREALSGHRRVDRVVRADRARLLRQLVRLSWEHYLHHPELVRLLQTENLLRGKYLADVQSVTKVAGMAFLADEVEGIIDAALAGTLGDLENDKATFAAGASA